MMHACRIACDPRLLLGCLKKLKHLKFGISGTKYDPSIISRWGTEYTEVVLFLPHLESLHIWAVDDVGWADEISDMKELRSLCIEEIHLTEANPCRIIDNLKLDEEQKPYLRFCKFGAFLGPDEQQFTDASAITDDLAVMDFARRLPHCVIETNWETYEHREFAKCISRFTKPMGRWGSARACAISQLVSSRRRP
jgi:hypothetical protein